MKIDTTDVPTLYTLPHVLHEMAHLQVRNKPHPHTHRIANQRRPRISSRPAPGRLAANASSACREDGWKNLPTLVPLCICVSAICRGESAIWDIYISIDPGSRQLIFPPHPV